MTDLPNRYDVPKDEDKLFSKEALEDNAYASERTRKFRLVLFGVLLLVIVGGVFGYSPIKEAVTLMYVKADESASLAYIRGSSLVLRQDGVETSIPLPVSNEAKIATEFEGGFAAAEDNAMTVHFMAIDGDSSVSVSIPTQVGEGEYIKNLFPAPGGVLAVVAQQKVSTGADLGLTTVHVNPYKRSVTTQFENAEGQVSRDGSVAVTKSKAGVFSLKEAESDTVLLTKENVSIWTYDFDHRVLAATDGNSVTVVESGQKSSFTPAVLHPVVGLQAVPADKEIWLTLKRPQGNHVVLAYTYKGRRIGVKLIDDNAVAVFKIPEGANPINETQ
jgi:hypothetical protein